jgi:predicted dehydrogenase
MAGETIRIALVGAGSMGQVHAMSFAGIPGVAVTTVMDRDPVRAASLAASLGVTPYTDLDAMLAGGPVDAIDCCLPTPLHRPTVEWAAARGLQIICEKPLALNLEDGRAMIAACRAAGVQLLMAQVVRFFPQYRRMADEIRAGRVGSPVSATLARQAYFPTGADHWFRDPAKSGGIFVDMMTHDLDWALQQFGPAERVYARLIERPEPCPFAQAMATVRHRAGVISLVTATWGHPGTFTTSVEVAGSAGLLRFQSGDAQPLRVLADAASEQRGAVSLANLTMENPYRTELAHFAAVLTGQATPLVRAEESLAALNLALAARSSAATGRAVPVQEAGV